MTLSASVWSRLPAARMHCAALLCGLSGAPGLPGSTALVSHLSGVGLVLCWSRAGHQLNRNNIVITTEVACWHTDRLAAWQTPAEATNQLELLSNLPPHTHTAGPAQLAVSWSDGGRPLDRPLPMLRIAHLETRHLGGML
jgi:hypothetical protein